MLNTGNLSHFAPAFMILVGMLCFDVSPTDACVRSYSLIYFAFHPIRSSRSLDAPEIEREIKRIHVEALRVCRDDSARFFNRTD